MKRFMGLMPSNEIEISKIYIDDLERRINIDAGKNGWTILYDDSSTEYADVVDTAENNFKSALKRLKEHFNVKELVK